MSTSPSQRDVINTMQGQLIGFSKDMEYLKKQADSTDTKLSAVIDTINKLAYVSLADYAKDQLAIDERFKALENYNTRNSLGVKFSNDIVGNILRTIVFAAALALLLSAANYIKNGGGK